MAANDFPHETCCGPLFREEVTSPAEEQDVVDDDAAIAKFGGVTDVIIWLDFFGVEDDDGTENAAEIPMTDDTADAATTAVAADRGLRDGCRETIMIIVILFCGI
eukprot:CAMPEP_0201732492 /NCGR_PEP_ID=MMETSP0593-20130828/28961_1 /ASSEMBLY_ACC=CAM_ASM_000672 /TAXON_ID=267983 /ORGANISM="Skeletonema japonicum, Strain CCMP2506" /LENGTH=104 /DNA_ID=CAMNT_0048225463 /DNA_START=232 /DNA_END=546 /DNA_ORIENTATION=+